MPYDSNISWTQTTWNVFSGCVQVSPGCDNCYALELAERYRGGPAYPNGFDLTIRFHKLNDPRKWKEPREVFVNSMSDMFLGTVPPQIIKDMWGVMLATPQHMYQILTKRPIPALRIIRDLKLPVPDHIWLGVSVEDQQRAVERIPALLALPGKNKFLSLEPLLGPLDLAYFYEQETSAGGRIRWAIDGGESGSKRRPADPDWFRANRDQCHATGVAYFHKQGNHNLPGRDTLLDGQEWHQHPNRPPYRIMDEDLGMLPEGQLL